MRFLIGSLPLCLCPVPALAHASEQGFVLLLPTGLYTLGGALVVVLTVVLLAAAGSWTPGSLLRPFLFFPRMPVRLRPVVQMLGLVALLILVWNGASGPTDPLRNPLTLGVWTVFWIFLLGVQALLFDIWTWVNPFAGLARLVRAAGVTPVLGAFRPGRCIAVIMFLCFAGFLMADPAPADPGRLAGILSIYLAVTGAGLVLVGPRWLLTAEFLTVLMRTYRKTAVFGAYGGRTGLGLNGWRILKLGAPALPLAMLMLILLGSGSFDGLNETFWWLGVLGVNPLEFPGRSAVVAPNVAGLLAMNAALVAAYGIAIRLGLSLAGGGIPFRLAFRSLAPSILPIAAGYHLAHYLTSFLVDGQHVLSAISHALGFGERHITTGFFNTLSSVRLIWSTQAGAVVIGHVMAILVAHALALKLFADHRRATLSQLPLALFMIAYTVFGLWLLAAPKGA